MAEWRAVAGWVERYEVSSDGLIRNLSPSGRWKGDLRGTVNNGYRRVTLRENGRIERRYVHQIVCDAFHGSCPTGYEVAHNNGDRLDCRADNLRWATRRENMRDKAVHGTQPRGGQIKNAKLTERQALETLQSSERNMDLAAKFGVNPSTISNVRTGKRWRHLSAAMEVA